MKFAWSTLFALIPLLLMSQQQDQISFNQLSVNQGLSQNSVVSIVQDQTGYLWFATQDGLNKYDGKQFTYYEKLFEDITRDNFSKLGKIYVDKVDKLYIVTKNGVLEYFDQPSDTFIQNTAFKNVSTLYQDKELQTWVGTYGNGLFKCTATDTVQMLGISDLHRDTYAITNFKSNTVAALSGTVIVFDSTASSYQHIKPNSSEMINFSSLAVKENELWAGSFGNGLFHKTSSEEILKQFTGFGGNQQLPIQLNIEALMIDAKGRLWIGTYGDGAYLINFETQRIRHFMTESNNPGAISYNDVLTIMQDNTGTIWLGTDGGGLSYYDENLNKFNILTNYQTPENASVDVVRAIAVDQSKTVWIGTSGNGLTSYSPASETYYNFRESGAYPYGELPSNRVMSLMSDGDDLWVGFQDAGLCILNKGKVTHFTSETIPPLDIKTVWCIYKDSKGSVWLGTGDGGLVKFDKNKGVVKQYTRSETAQDGISSNNIRAITEGAKGELWIGTENMGINRLFEETNAFVHYNQDALKNVKSLHYQNGLLWIGTNGQGLVKFDTQSLKMEQYSLKDGLPNNVIYGILPDEENNLWLSSNRGITNLQFDAKNKPLFTNYDIYDGLQSYEFNTGAAYKDADGILYFGGLKGINWFQPEALQFNTSPPKTTITSLEIFNEEVKLNPGATFKHNQNTMSFTFAALHYSQPERNSYKHILEGYDPTWSKASNANFAHYAKLPPGNYTFKVLSSNYDDIWGTTPASYSFTIKSPWYLTTIAKFSYLLALLTLLYIIYKYLKSRWQMQLELKLEYAETQRLKKLDELKSKLYTNISHEFRTPLTLISGPIQQLVANGELSSADQRALQVIEGSSERMLRLVNQLLDLSKLEEGSVQLQVTKGNMTPQLTQLAEAFSLQANEKGIRLISKLSNLENVWFDKDVLEKVASNLLSNAIKYAPENSDVIFTAEKNENYMTISVENENTSLKEKDLVKLYDRFYQVDKNAEGVGIGLSLIKELVTLTNGTLEAIKNTPETIQFKVRLPISKELYNANAIISEEKITTEIVDTIDIFDLETTEEPIILVVEDNKEVRNYIISLFSNSGKILSANDGLAGIKKAIKNVPDVIISDIMMPVKDGIELCNTLKQDVRTSHIPILLLTAKAGDTAIIEGLQNQADDYITKPFNPEILRQKVKNLIATRLALQKRYSQHVYLSPKEIAVTSYDESFLTSLQEVIDNRITESDFSSEIFAKELNLSRMQLHRKLKALTGLSTSEFIRSQRLKAAVKLLESSDLTISEVAYSVGFNTPSYFIKCFKKTFDKTPSEYMNKEA